MVRPALRRLCLPQRPQRRAHQGEAAPGAADGRREAHAGALEPGLQPERQSGRLGVHVDDDLDPALEKEVDQRLGGGGLVVDQHDGGDPAHQNQRPTVISPVSTPSRQLV